MPLAIRKLVENDFPSVAKFIAEINSDESQNITDLGTDPAEVENFIRDDLLDLKATDGFLLAFDNKKLCGVWGWDYDSEKGYLYSLGPYINHDYWEQVAEALWREIKKLIPVGSKEIIMSLNAKNENCAGFAIKHGFKRMIVGLELKLKAGDFNPVDYSYIAELTEDQYEDFCALHDKLFPGTYYSGRDIIGRSDNVRKVFVTDPVTGYIYVEPRPEFGTANLEFIGVDPANRGQGLGQALLSKGIDYVFSFDSIKEIALAVREDNPARRLYEKVGFIMEKIVHSYEKQLS